DDLAGLMKLDLIGDEERSPLQQLNPAAYALGASVCGGQIRNRQRALRRGTIGYKRRLRFLILIRAVDRQRVVAFGSKVIVAESILAEISRQVVIVGPQINRPALAQRVKDKCAQIQMRMIGFVVAAFEA